MNLGQHLLLAWTVFAFLGIGAMITAIMWGVRTRQFSNQDHIRNLPLESPYIKNSQKHCAFIGNKRSSAAKKGK